MTIKRMVLLSSVLGILLLSAWFLLAQERGQKPLSALPWNIEVDEQGQVAVFDFKLGQITLREMIEQLQHFPEVALFTDTDVEPRLEAYFGKRRLGVFEARLLAEIELNRTQANTMLARSLERKAQPSGRWKYTLSEQDLEWANTQRVKYLVYMPVADYTTELVHKHFGRPEQNVLINEQANYLFYPQQGLVLMLGQEAGDVLHYSTLADYAALRQRLSQELSKENP